MFCFTILMEDFIQSGLSFSRKLWESSDTEELFTLTQV